MKMALPVLLGALMAAGCAALGGDMIIRVSGSMPVSGASGNGRPDDVCQLGLVSPESGERSLTRDVPAEFATTMMVVAGPKPRPYYFVAECSDGRRFRSDEVAISSRSSYSREFDLGVLFEEP